MPQWPEPAGPKLTALTAPSQGLPWLEAGVEDPTPGLQCGMGVSLLPRL